MRHSTDLDHTDQGVHCLPRHFVPVFRIIMVYILLNISASRNNPPQPPPYTPPQGPIYQAPPPAYSAPHNDYYAWVPYQTFPSAPPRKLQILFNLLLILVGCFGFNGPLRQYFSLYRAVSQRRGEREEKR